MISIIFKYLLYFLIYFILNLRSIEIIKKVEKISRMDKKVEKLQLRFDTAIAQKHFYEAHQILRTMHNRMVQQSGECSANRHLQLLYSGCLAMIEGKEFASAFDLAQLYVETLKKTGQTLDNDCQFDRIISLFSQLPSKLESTSMNSIDDLRTPFLNKTLDWALKSAEGRPELLQLCVKLQRKLSQILAEEGQTEQAERLDRAAEWLMNEIDRGTQCSSASMASASSQGNTDGAAASERKMEDVEIDLD